MSTQGKVLPWSRGRGFRPKGPFQPARRPGEPATTEKGDIRPAQNNSNSVNSNQGYNKPPASNQGNNGYMRNEETGYIASQGQNSTQNRPAQNSYQGNKFGNQGNGASKDIRFAAAQQQQQNSRNFIGASQVQSKQNGTGGAGNREEVRVLAKYNYKANPSSPLGEPELSLTQGHKLSLITKHPSNDQWWKVRADDGSEGYVPASYVMVLENKVTSLPWLANKEAAEEPLPQCKPVFKPYKSAYDKDGQVKSKGSEPAEKKPNPEWYCAVCDKQLNGPKPYGAHMASKAHREEVELAKENDTCVDPY